jgi:hypothetical protein
MFLATMEMAVRMQGRATDQLAFARPVEAPAAPVEKPATAAPDTSEAAPAVPVTTPDASPTASPAEVAEETSPADSGTHQPRPLMSDQMVEDILLKGLSPEEQRDIRAAAARATHRASLPVPIAGYRGLRP